MMIDIPRFSGLIGALVLMASLGVPPHAMAITSEQAQAIVDESYQKIQELKEKEADDPFSTIPVNPEFETLSGLEEFGQNIFTGVESFLGDSSLRLFQPTTRIYFDTGDDDADEPDIFDDGSLVPVITLAEIRFTNYFFPSSAKKDDDSGEYNINDRTPWSWGFATGLGATVAAESGEDSTAPVVLVTAGMFLEYDLNSFGKTKADYQKWTKVTEALGLPSSGPTVGLEAGWVYGLSADENFDDKDDSAWYVGLTVYVPF